MCCGNRKSFLKIAAVAAAVLLVSFLFTHGRDGESPDGFSAEPGHEWPPDAVIAQINGYTVTQEDFSRRLDAELDGSDGGHAINEYVLLEMMLRGRLLYEKAREHGIQDTSAFADAHEKIKKTERSGSMTEDEMRRHAMSEAYLVKEVIENLDIAEEDLKQMYLLYKPSMPEGTVFEDVKDILLNKLQRQYVERHIINLFEGADLSINEDWAQQKKREARELHTQCPVSGCSDC